MQYCRLAALVLLLLAAPLACADTRLGDACDLNDMQLGDKAEFLRFDSALKQASSRGDAAALALLVDFPLRVNAGHGSVLQLANRAALEAHFQAVFSNKITQAIAAQKPEQVWCNGEGQMMYGDGALWIRSVKVGARTELRVATINAEVAPSAAATTQSAPAWVCNAEHLRAVVDDDANGNARYRVWNKPHAPPNKADLELEGQADLDGHGTCATRVWHFHNGTTQYTASAPRACSADNATAHASIEIVIDGKPAITLRCD